MDGLQQLDKKMIIHVAAEMIIIGGMCFWLNSKINGQNAVIEQLQKENRELAARLKKIEDFLINATGAAPPPASPPKERHKKKKAHKGTTSEDESIIKDSEEDQIEI